MLNRTSIISRAAVLALTAAVILSCNRRGGHIDQSELEELTGIHSANLPCADCQTVSFQLMINDNGTYQALVRYLGTLAEPVQMAGKLKKREGRFIELAGMPDDYKLLERQPDGLLLLDEDGERIEGPDAGAYLLVKTVAAPTNTESQEAKRAFSERNAGRYEMGVHFYAMGTEPFWNLNIDRDKGMSLTTMDGFEINTPPVNAVEVADSNLLRYRAETELGDVEVVVTREKCTDQMSGERFFYSVSVQARYSTDSTYQQLSGCGSYTINPDLEGRWELVSVDGKVISADDYAVEVPWIDLKMEGKVVLCYDGCNNLRGTFEPGNYNIRIDRLAGTLRNCDNMDSGLQIRRDLTSADLSYSLKGGTLTLKGTSSYEFVSVN